MRSSLRFSPAKSAHRPLVWLFLLLVGLPWLARAQCPNAPVFLRNQAQVDAFPPGCVNLSGQLTISGADITNLSSLSALQSTGIFAIENNPSLVSLKGLNNLSKTPYLLIRQNAKLIDLQGLTKLESAEVIEFTSNAKLTSLSGLESLKATINITIQGNDELISLQGLNQLQFVSGGLALYSNPKLASLSGLESLSAIKSSIIVQNNAELISLQGLNQLQSAGDIDFRNNAKLTSLSGLESLTTTQRSVLIQDHAELINLQGLNQLQSVGGNLDFRNNGKLTSLRGLESLRSVSSIIVLNHAELINLQGLNQLQSADDLEIADNGKLTSFSGLESLRIVNGQISIQNHAELTSLQGLSLLQSIGSTLELLNNPKLTSLRGLESLRSVNLIRIQSNAELTSLQGLNQLQSAGNLDFRSNPKLTSLSGLESLRSVNGQVLIQSHAELTSLESLRLNQGGSLDIRANPKLSVCANPSICSLLAQGVPSNIQKNAPGCNSVADIQADCAPLAITSQPPGTSAVCVGSTVTATVSTTGNARAYQWYKGNQVVTGQTTNTLSLTNVQTTDAGTYRVVVSNSVSSLTSTAFNLTVTTQSPDYQPLADLYTSTNGGNWKRNNNWLTGCSPCNWDGVTCDGSGRVTGLSLASNNLSGSIPASLSALTNLQTLDLQRNSLSGPIPASLSALTNLQQLILSDNELSGSIPASLGNLTNLRILLLDYSGLSGSIPASLGNLTNLQQLNLYDIRLSGSIPASFSALTNLESLDLSSNYLSGPIPAGLGNLTKLNTLKLNSNSLSGCFPASLSALCGKDVNFSNNPDLPGRGDFAAFCANGAGSTAFRPQATANPNPVCAGNSVNLSVSTGTSYQWSGPASFTASTQNPSFITASAASSGLYSVTVGSGGSTCQVTATTSVSLTVNPLPTVSITPSATAICAGQSATFSATPGLATYRWSTPNNGPVLTTASISVSVAGTYSLTVTNASGCSATATASLTVNPLPTPAIVGLVSSICQEAPPISLTGTGSPAGGIFTIDGLTATTFNPAKLAVGQHTVVYSYTNTSGCSNTTSQTVTVKPTPQPPTIATQSGHSYPAGVSSLTASQNTGDVVLTASGCMGGTITWAGGNSTTLAVSTVNTGTQTFSATCSNNGCTSPLATATITVVGTTLSVLHRDGNGNTSTNTLAPYLQLNNDGKTAIPYAEITLRYWLTVENYSPLLFSINYAQLGSDKVHLKYVPATTGNPKASGYIEFSFDGSAGSLAPMSNSGPIQDIINKQDYSYFDQSNDYSYVNTGQYTPNPRITAYRNGTIFYGMEPGVVTPTRSLKAQLQNNTGDGANTIEAVLSVTNDGSLPVNYGDLKVRYYFTADNTQPLVLSQVGYTALGSGNVTAQLVPISPALGGADTYLELSFSSGLGQLAPGASTGGVTYQIRHGDYSGFTQANDYSYQGTGGMALAPHVVVLVGGQRVWGTEPGASGRLAAAEPQTPLQVRVLGNPVAGASIELEVRGAEGQPLRVQVSDQQGRAVSERMVETAVAVEHQTLSVAGQPAGLLLLRVSTPSQSQTVKVLKTE